MAKLHLSRADGQVFFFLPLSSSPERGVARKGKEKLFPPLCWHTRMPRHCGKETYVRKEGGGSKNHSALSPSSAGGKEAQLNILTPFALFIHRLWREIDRAALEIHLCALPVCAVVEAVKRDAVALVLAVEGGLRAGVVAVVHGRDVLKGIQEQTLFKGSVAGFGGVLII